MADVDDGHTWTPCRITFHVGAMGSTASLFRSDAGPFTTAFATFDVHPEQPLPRVDAGAPALLRDDRAVVLVAGVEVWPRGKFHKEPASGMPAMFADRTGVIAHPAASGWSESWRYSPSPSRWSVTEAERQWRSARRGFIVAVGMLAVTIAVWTWGWLAQHRGPVVVYFGLGAMVAAAWRARRRAVAAERALDAARSARPQPARRMLMTLRWLVGEGAGPVAAAVLSDGADHQPVTVVLTGVPAGFDPPAGTEVCVRGDLRTGGVTIECGDVVLWPAGPPTVGRRDRRRPIPTITAL